MRTIPDDQRLVRVGEGAVPPHEKGGWALPGGGRTTDRLVAYHVAQALDHLIRKAGGLPRFAWR